MILCLLIGRLTFFYANVLTVSLITSIPLSSDALSSNEHSLNYY